MLHVSGVQMETFKNLFKILLKTVLYTILAIMIYTYNIQDLDSPDDFETIANQTTFNTTIKNEELKKRFEVYQDQILQVARNQKINPYWIAAVVWTESHFNPKAQSPMGATGLMQITKPTAIYICQRLLKRKNCQRFNDQKTFDKEFTQKTILNLEYGTAYLKYLYQTFNRDKRLATLAYNEGPTRVRSLQDKILSGEIFDSHQYFNKIDHRMAIVSDSLNL